jgi:amino acid efflux transporter
MITLVVSYFLSIDLQTALLIPSGAAILVYVIGSASGIRLLKGTRPRVYPWISLGVSLVMLPFVGVVLVVSVLVALFGLFYRRIRGLRR